MTAPVSRTGATDREVEARKWLQIELEEGDHFHNAEAIRWALDRIAELEANAARAAAAPDSGQRERLARHLADHYGEHPVRDMASWRIDADAVLALLAEQPGGGR